MDEVLEIIRFNNDISIIKISEFLEYLDDNNMLNEKGSILNLELWERFIKE